MLPCAAGELSAKLAEGASDAVFARNLHRARGAMAQNAAIWNDCHRTVICEGPAGLPGLSVPSMSFLLSALPAPLDFLSWGLLTGPLGLILMGAGAMALHITSVGEADEI
jgi:hypothetical protein